MQMGLPTVSWSLGDDVCLLDLDLSGDGEPRPFGEPERLSLEEAVNADVLRSASVVVRSYAPDSPQLAAARTRGLPAGLSGPVRVVELEGDAADEPLDRNMCCGTHVSSLAHLQLVSLLSAQTLTLKRRPCVRISFVAADRARARLAADAARGAALSKLLSVPPAEHVARVVALQAASTAAERAASRLLAELAAAAARDLAAQAAAGALAPSYVRGPDGERAAEFVKALAALGVASAPGSRPALVAVPADDAGEQGMFAIFGSASQVAALAPAVCAALAGRGGGKSTFQGKATKLVSGWEAAIQALALVPLAAECS
jgi:misacylated tRNA(Ala) deacylase